MSVVAATAPAWLPAVASLGGNLIGGLLGKSGQTSANQSNERIAQDNRDFQERMSSTARQREVKDLRKAGLNPILAAGGSGASTPSGSTATMQNENASIANTAKTLIPDMMNVINTQANTAKIVESGKLIANQSQLTKQKFTTEISNTDLVTQKAYGERFNNLIKQPNVMESNFLTDVYEFASDQLGTEIVAMSPSAILNYVGKMASAFFSWRKSGKTRTTTTDTAKARDGSTSTYKQESFK